MKKQKDTATTLKSFSWDDYDGWIKNIVSQIKKSKKEYVGVHGLTRGGLIPAVHLSHALGIDYTEQIFSRGRLLIVDDINDTGKTLTNLIPFLSTECDVAVLIEREESIFKATFVAKQISKTEPWVIFPWETITSTKRQCVKKGI